jgi:two-component system sensor histidine kinase DegS
VSIRYELWDGRLKIELSDDGKGFGPDREGAGNGLLNMKSRARKLNGTLYVHAEADRGTLISLTLPVKRTEPAAPAGMLR